MTEDRIRACLDAGASAVVAKSINESPAAARQLDIAEYVALSSDHGVRPWDSADLTVDSFLCRSGLAQSRLDAWLEMLARCDQYALRTDAYVIGSITVSELEPAAELAAQLGEAVRCVEVNLSAIHGKVGKSGAVHVSSQPDDVRRYTESVRKATDVPLIIKLTGQTADVVALAEEALAGGADIVCMIGRFPGFVPDLETRRAVMGSSGAIGGYWALPISMYWVSETRARLGPQVPIIGTNGARSGHDVIRFMLSGASCVQIASILCTHGPSKIAEILSEVEAYVRDSGEQLQHLIGLAADGAENYADIHPSKTRQDDLPWLSQ